VGLRLSSVPKSEVGVAVRIFLSGPRILGGLIRPGISFALSELTGKPARRHRAPSPPCHEAKIPQGSPRRQVRGVELDGMKILKELLAEQPAPPHECQDYPGT